MISGREYMVSIFVRRMNESNRSQFQSIGSFKKVENVAQIKRDREQFEEKRKKNWIEEEGWMRNTTNLHAPSSRIRKRKRENLRWLKEKGQSASQCGPTTPSPSRPIIRLIRQHCDRWGPSPQWKREKKRRCLDERALSGRTQELKWKKQTNIYEVKGERTKFKAAGSSSIDVPHRSVNAKLILLIEMSRTIRLNVHKWPGIW